MISNQDLLDELLSMKEVGIEVSDGALNHARIDDLSEYEGIGVEQLASLFCEMYHWNTPMKTKNYPLIREIQLGRTVEEVVDEHLLPDYDLHGCYGEGADIYDIVREIVRKNNKWLRFAVEIDPGSCNIIVLNDSSDLSMSYWDDDYGYALSDNAEADCQTLNEIVERIYGTKRKKPKPKMSQEEFAEKEGENCPYCGRVAIVLDKVTWNNRDTMGCGGCGEMWFRTHKKVITGFE